MLEAVRDMSDWNNRSQLPKGTGKGVAFQFAHAGYVAYVVEVAVGDDKKINVNKAWAAIDIGRQIVNPSQSVESGAGRVHRGDEPHDGVADHDRQGPRGADATSTTISRRA